MTTSLDRRNFLSRTLTIAGGALAVPSLAGLAACNDATPTGPDGVPRLARAPRGGGGYGALVPDPGGLPYLIPPGFRLRRISRSGLPMKRPGAGTVPNAFDGMAAFPLPNGNVRLIRNHEMRDTGNNAVPIGTRPWDARAGGGCTSLEVAFDPSTGEPTLVDEFVSISGTHVNCAGGPTPWGSWLTCEETTAAASANGFQRNHGYIFEIPASATEEIEPVPLTAMGRFSHEAIAVDRNYGHVYMTEDDGTSSGFYRFIPNVQGDLRQGGRVQMLALTGRPQFNTSSGQLPRLVPIPAHWVDIANPDPAVINAQTRLAAQGLALGACRFSRLEGAWWGDEGCYFDATSGGAAGAGQIFHYKPTSADRGHLMLVFESPNSSVLDSPDNICVSPRGGIVICEDGGGEQFLRGLTRDGRLFDLVRTNAVETTEFAGSCFSPDGRYLFFNQQGSTNRLGSARGNTFVLWGPWEQGAL